jgi:hypothetical protein
MKKGYILLIFFAIIFNGTKADFISLIRADQCETIVEIFIHEEGIKVTFEVGEKDYPHFKKIVPDIFYKEGYAESTQEQSFVDFLQNDFTIKADGRKLSGTINKIQKMNRNYRTSLYTGQVDSANITISPVVIYAEAYFPLSYKPETVTLHPPMEEGYKSTLANIGFVTYHKQVPVHDLRYLGQDETVQLNWKDPWYTKYTNINLRRHHKNSLMEYLYIDPYEVRHEVLIRLKDLEYWIPLNYDIDDKIEGNEVDSIKNYVAEFMIKRNKVIIDGIEVPPILDKVHFIQVAMSGIQIIENPDDMDFATAIIGIILAYPHDSIPQQVVVKWDMFNDQVDQIPCMMTDPAGPFPYMLMKEDTALVWQNYMKNYQLPTISEVKVQNASIYIPFISVLMLLILITMLRKQGIKIGKWKTSSKIIGFVVILFLLAGWIIQWRVEIPFIKQKSFDIPEAKELITDLLKNTYRAFDFRSESDVYDKLATSNEGELLSEIYIQTKQSMVLENQGGLQVKLKDVNIEDVVFVGKEEEGLVFRTTWQVQGDVGHWGHIHKRTNQYDAFIKVKPVEGIWKMYDIEIVEEARII